MGHKIIKGLTEAAAHARIEKLEAVIDQIRLVCEDNFSPECDKRMALDFVHQIAVSARPTPAVTSRNRRHRA